MLLARGAERITVQVLEFARPYDREASNQLERPRLLLHQFLHGNFFLNFILHHVSAQVGFYQILYVLRALDVCVRVHLAQPQEVNIVQDGLTVPRYLLLLLLQH